MVKWLLNVDDFYDRLLWRCEANRILHKMKIIWIKFNYILFCEQKSDLINNEFFSIALNFV